MGLVSEKDFILRVVKEMTALFAYLLGLRKGGKPEQALEELKTAGDDILGVPRSVLDMVDVASATRMLADPYKVRFYARLLREEAEILAELGRDDGSARTRSAELIVQATRMKGGSQPQDAVELRALGDLSLPGEVAAAVAKILGA